MNVAVQGNTLVGEQVLQACRDNWLARPDLRLKERLLHSLAASTAAGGDLCGQQCAVPPRWRKGPGMQHVTWEPADHVLRT